MKTMEKQREENQGEQNRHILDLLGKATRGVETLVARGFTVLSVKLACARPLIEIQQCHECRELNGANLRKVELPNRRTMSTMTTRLGDCDVQWIAFGSGGGS